MKLPTRLAMVSLCLPLLIAAVLALPFPQDDEASVEARAVELLQHELGIWQSRWEFLGPDGKVAQVWEGTETFQPGPSERVVIVETEVPEVGNKSISIRFYHPIERKIYFASVGQNGDFWLLTEPVGSSVLTSEPHMNADGSVSTIRFTTLEKDDDSMKVLMEQSRDGGKTWRPVFRQYLTRTKQD